MLKRLARLAVNAYPRAWRDRYQVEMVKVLEGHKVSLATVIDLAIGVARAWFLWPHKGRWRAQMFVGVGSITFVCLFVFAGFQQSMRMGANQPQIQMTQHVTSMMTHGQSVNGFHTSHPIEIQQSLAPFLVIYNNQGAPVVSTGELYGRTPVIPMGVLAYAKQHGQDKLTWQPEQGVRIAAVVQYHANHGGGFVLAGRSLRVVEQGETSLLKMIEMAWLVLMGGLIAMVIALGRRRKSAKV